MRSSSFCSCSFVIAQQNKKKNPCMQTINNAIDLQLIKNKCGTKSDLLSIQFGIATIARNSSIKKSREYFALTILLNIIVLPFIKMDIYQSIVSNSKAMPVTMQSMSLCAQAISVGDDSCSN